jgi:hypothetical protein
MKKIYFLFLFVSLIGFAQNPGDLIITEIMNNPDQVSDTVGEWFEVYNLTANPIDMDGWTLKDDGSNLHVLDAAVGGNTVVPANGYLVLGRSSNTSENGNAPVDYAYGSDGQTLGNGSDEIVLVLPDGTTEIARVEYDNGATFPDLTGESMQLDPAFLNANDYDNGGNWCPSLTAYGDGDLGTPGMSNEACAPTCEAELGFSDATCDATNPGATDDTYTVTLDYTGAATGEIFVVSTTPGGFTIGGDDPNSIADGTITITGVTEGTDITISVSNTADGGLCDLTRDITSPVCVPTGSVDLELVGVLDFDTPAGGASGKAIHLVATADIADLSEYGLGVANNGGGTDGEEFTFPVQSVNNGDHILLPRDAVAIEAYLTTPGINLFNLVIETDLASGNGNDAVELFKNGAVVETFGDINDGNAAAAGWDYGDAWAYKDTPGAVWPNGWIYGPTDCSDGSTTTFDSTCVYPFVESLSSNQFEATEFLIYPNPATEGFVNIESNIEGIKNIEIFDLNGRNIKNTTIQNQRLEVSDLNSGVYFIRISVSDYQFTQKLIIR